MELVCVTVDCADPAAVAGFWSKALGWNVVEIAADGSGAVCRPSSGGAYLEFVRVPEDKAGKNRLHLGCSAGPLHELDDEITRLQALGATIAWEEEFSPAISTRYRNVVMRDVEGNEFCLGAGSFHASPRDGIVVRQAVSGDRPPILQLAKRLATTTPPWRDRDAVERAVTESVNALLDEPRSSGATFVAEADGDVVGFLTVSQRSHFTGAVDASIDDLAVAEGWEGRGVASALLDHADAWARQHSLQRITVETTASNNRALRRYRAHGYQDEDVRLTKHLGG